LPAERFDLDPLTAHTIRLVQHAKKLRIMISNLQLAHQENVSDMQLARKINKIDENILKRAHQDSLTNL
jgi:hypothetical protein